MLLFEKSYGSCPAIQVKIQSSFYPHLACGPVPSDWINLHSRMFSRLKICQKPDEYMLKLYYVLMELGQDVRYKKYQTNRYCISQFTISLTFSLTNTKLTCR